jgi:predicted GNAT family N-acyltransferase
VADPFRIEPLGRQHQRDDFQCGHDALDRYLRQQARQEADKHVAAPFVLVQGDDPAVLGYYTLSASSISTADVAPEMASKLPRYPQLPVTLIGRLAVDNRLKGQGRGAFLLIDALRRSFEHAVSVAAVAIVVDAKDEGAAAFYRHFRFLALQKDPRRLYLPMKTVAQLLE